MSNFFSEFEGLIWLNIWYYIVFSLRKQHLAGTESIPFNEIFDFMENLLFVLFQELPFVRYHAAKATDDSTETFRDSIPAKLAAGVFNNLLKYKCIPNFPQTETCELLILDRSIDQVVNTFNVRTCSAWSTILIC